LTPRARVLIVEDRASLARMLERALAGEGYEVEAAADGRRGISRLAERRFDLVLTDLKLPGASGLEVLSACREARPPVPVVVMTAYGTVSTAVEAMKLGALDFLEKPVALDDLLRLVAGAVGEHPESAVFEPPGAPALVGSHPRFRAALHLLERVAPTESTVLLLGESGTGKELFARAIHALSPRGAGPFVAVNCAAIPESLLENELFGHEKGAYTGASQRQLGRFELARGGTLLLDEIGELSPAVQAKVLRVLEQRTFERVGGGTTLTAEVRLVAATNRDLRQLADAGRFRQDLLFRLDVFPIELPPLRERAGDVPALARHLLVEIAARHRREPPQLADEAAALLAAQSWPGNIRQLGNVLERAFILASGPRLSRRDLEPLLTPLAGGAERERLKAALVAADGDKHRAAEALGWSYRTVVRKVKEHGLEGVPRYREG
jgi:DNA-binding NtrC family response regulator